MKFLASILVFGLSASAFAGNLYYTDGPAKGKDVAKIQTYIGYNDICFVGSGEAARASLYNILAEDYELEGVFSKFDKTKDKIVYGYLQTKCTDDGLSEAECRSVKTAKRCL